jgi:hypothetical protein
MSLFENVLGLEATNHGRDFDYVLSTILATGFVVQSLRSDPSTLGKCYRRPRIFLVLMRQDLAIVSSWLLMDYQPTRDQCLQKRKTFSVARDHLGLTLPPADLRADGAVFLTLAEVTLITKTAPLFPPSGPTHSRPLVYCHWSAVSPRLTDQPNNCFVVGYVTGTVPTNLRSARAQHKIFHYNGLLPTMTTFGQGFVYVHTSQAGSMAKSLAIPTLPPSALSHARR